MVADFTKRMEMSAVNTFFRNTGESVARQQRMVG